MDRKAHGANASDGYEGPNSPRYDRRHRSSGRADALTSRPIPFGTGLVASFDRPGGNLTGLFMDQSSLGGKWIGLLRDVAPQVQRVALVWDPNSAPDQLEAAKAAASTLKIDALTLEVRKPEEFERAFETLGNERRTGLVL